MNGAMQKLADDAESSRIQQLATPSPEPESGPEEVISANARKLESVRSPDVITAIAQKLEDARAFDGAYESSLISSSTVALNGMHPRPSASNANAGSRPTPPPPLKVPKSGEGRRKSSISDDEKVLKLSPREIHALTSEPASLPIRAATPIQEEVLDGQTLQDGDDERDDKSLGVQLEPAFQMSNSTGKTRDRSRNRGAGHNGEAAGIRAPSSDQKNIRPTMKARSATGPPVMRRKQSGQRKQPLGLPIDTDDRRSTRLGPSPFDSDQKDVRDSREPLKPPHMERRHGLASPVLASMPIPPLSMPTFLSLELSSHDPSPLYIYRPSTADFPYESSKITYDRLVNFFLLPPKLEAVLGFGTLASLDAWMHVLTILPLRFSIAIGILVRWWGSVVVKEAGEIYGSIRSGLPRLWQRRREAESQASTPVVQTPVDEQPPSLRRNSSTANHLSDPTTRTNGHTKVNAGATDVKDAAAMRKRNRYRHRRTKSTPSLLLPTHKADILKGLLVIFSCVLLMRSDASRMYHGIRGQSAIKLYVIYNVLEVCDRLLSALGQDVLECLFSRETLDRNADGRSKVLRPLWMFCLALAYNVAHATALLYQVITLNVAVNSYSNALLTLLMSNQFVEIKGTVFKRFEKENLFQITCADIVERFQLWLMLLIIGMRNIVEVGGLSIGNEPWNSGSGPLNSTATSSTGGILPMSFTIFPKWIGQVLNPFLLVLGSEMVVDWLKHAYITKFNQTKPEVYDKFLDVLAKDYYTDAFSDPKLTRRLGLPVLPLACLFVRAAIQTYHMLVATHMPLPIPSPSTSLTSDSPPASSPATTAALAHIDSLFRRALGRSSFASSTSPTSSFLPAWLDFFSYTTPDLIALLTALLLIFLLYLFFLSLKLLLGMFLLSLSRARFAGMKAREKADTDTGGKRLGGFGTVDVDAEKRRWIYEGDGEGLARVTARDEKERDRARKERECASASGAAGAASAAAAGGGVSTSGPGTGTKGFAGVRRYSMVGKRIW